MVINLCVCGYSVIIETMKEIREATNGGYALGGKRFLAQTEAAAGRRVTRGKAGRPGCGAVPCNSHNIAKLSSCSLRAPARSP